ncbi:MAG TPA: glycosyltransferase family 9 protein [Cyclobacteriaceae bacterium]|nr:glycosyltransferase family 9 protein [Cyclobacteriaceae bacterium]
MPPFRSFLIIQTAFIGDVILATGLIEKLRQYYPEASIDFLLRKGNEGLLTNHPLLRNVLIWDKKESKIFSLFRLIGVIRNNHYDVVVNIHRYASSGFITALSGGTLKIGFDKNPLSFLFNKRIPHQFGALHEVERNHKLIESVTDQRCAKPKLYPSLEDFGKMKPNQSTSYICIAPTSVWFTKQYPVEKWIEFLQSLKNRRDKIYLLGAPSDYAICESIRLASANDRVVNLAGKLSFLESAALMKGAVMNFVNDSAPMHIASAMNAPVTAIYCSTVPSFGYGPLSDRSTTVETREKLDCRPCGLHGFKTCPKGHFKCGHSISNAELISSLP